MTRSGPIARALAASLRRAPADDRDAAGVAMARHYALLLDNAAPNAKYVKALNTLRSVVDGRGDDAQAAFELVAKALAAHSVASDLGPKLKDLLTALGLTPAGRRAAKGDEPDVPARPGPEPADGTVVAAEALERLRRERAGGARRP